MTSKHLNYLFHMRTKTGLVNLGSTRFYEFRSHAPISRAFCFTCYLGNWENGVRRRSVGNDPFYPAVATAKVRTAAQDSSVKGGSQKKARGTFSLKTKAKADVFPSSNFELFCKGDFSSTNDLDESKESYFLIFLPTLLCVALVALSR